MRRYGYKGFYDKVDKPIVLTKKTVEGIHLQGGTILGTSRGGADIRSAKMAVQTAQHHTLGQPSWALVPRFACMMSHCRVVLHVLPPSSTKFVFD